MIDSIGQPKIVDFGIARLTEDTDGVTQQTNVGQVIGSIGSMSPEQLAGDRDAVDTRTDVYALGVMLYRILTGRAPHDLTGMSIPEAARVVAEQEPTPLSSIDPALRGDLTVIAAKSLERDIDQRYDSAAALGEDLRRTLRDEPIAARPQAQWYRLRKFVQRNRALVWSSGVGLALLIVASGASIWFGLDAIHARQREQVASYKAAISAAAAAVRDGDARLAREFLASAPVRLRGWEWWHFRHATDMSHRVGDRPDPRRDAIADYLYGASWLSPDGSTLHVAGHYLDHAHTFESYDTVSMRLLHSWSAPAAERCLGFIEDRTSLVLFDSEVGTYVERDVASGRELDRWDAPSQHANPLGSYDDLPGDPSERTAWLKVAIQSQDSRPLPGTFTAQRMEWVPWIGQDAAVQSAHPGANEAVLLTSPEGNSRTQFSPDGTSVAIATLDRRVILFDAQTGERVWEHTDAHDDAPMSTAFSPDGSLLATAGQDRLIKFWDVADGEPAGQLMGHDHTVVAMCFAQDGNTLFSADDASIRMWRVDDATDPNVIVRHSTFAGGVHLSPDGSTLVSRVTRLNRTATRREIKVTDVRSDRPPRMLPLPPDLAAIVDLVFIDPVRIAVLAATHSPVNNMPSTKEVFVMEFASGRVIKALDLGRIQARAMLRRSDVLTVMATPIVEIDLTTMAIRAPTPGVQSNEPWLRAVPNAEWIGDDGSVIHDFGIRGRCSVVDRARGRAFLASSDHLYVLDLSSGQRSATIGPLEYEIRSLAILPDGSRLFGGCDDTTIRVWDPDTLKLVAVLRGHRDTINDLAISEDGTTLYSASDDYTVRAWRSPDPPGD